MELRDFFTKQEIEEMKKKIIEQTALYAFLTTQDVPEDGKIYKYHVLAEHIQRAVKQQTVDIVKDYTKEIIHTVAKEKVSAAVEKFTANLCDQLDKITAKTSWYWSIK